MSGYLSKIAVRSAENKQAGRPGGFISPAVRSTDDITDIIQKEPPPGSDNISGRELTPPMPPGQLSNTLSKIDNSAPDFSISPMQSHEKNLHEGKPSVYLNNLANRVNAGEPVNGSPQNNGTNATDDIAVASTNKAVFFTPKNTESQNAAVQPTEIIRAQKPGEQRDNAMVSDPFMPEHNLDDTFKVMAKKQPAHIISSQKEALPFVKASGKETMPVFNPVENKAAANPPGGRNQGQKIVIGKITVEVLSAPAAPVKTQQNMNRRPPDTPNNKINNVHKLSYGLGQL